MMRLTILVSLVSSEEELISRRELKTSPPSALFPTGANDPNERLTCRSETRRMGEEGAGRGARMSGSEMCNTISGASNEGLQSKGSEGKDHKAH